MKILNILLMAPAEGGEGNSMTSFLFIGGMILVFWLFFIRPQSKKVKEQKKFRESLSKGDRVVTIGGIHGKIAEQKENTIVIETEGGHRLKIERSAVSMEYSSGNEPVEALGKK
ncbi:MAG: preprotein translocase subunit YajC [Flavobacteriales bacterium]|nr:MAG: preprotein translocase subunit YajC [Flavobacteriales bacterium]